MRTQCFNWIREKLTGNVANIQKCLALPEDVSLIHLNDLTWTNVPPVELNPRPLLFQLHQQIIAKYLLKPMPVCSLFKVRKAHPILWNLGTQCLLDKAAKKFPLVAWNPFLSFQMLNLKLQSDKRIRKNNSYNSYEAKKLFAVSDRDLKNLERNWCDEYYGRDVIQVALLKYKTFDAIEKAVERVNSHKRKRKI